MQPVIALSKPSQPALRRLSLPPLWDKLRLLPGVVLSAALAAVAIRLGTTGWLQAHGLSGLTVAIVLGIVLGNTIYPSIAARSGAGVVFLQADLVARGCHSLWTAADTP